MGIANCFQLSVICLYINVCIEVGSLALGAYQSFSFPRVHLRKVDMGRNIRSSPQSSSEETSPIKGISQTCPQQ